MVSVKWSANALAHLTTLDPIIRKRILAKVSWLEENFTNIIPEPLHMKLKGLYKIRAGDYRIIYSISRDIITIESVGHRRDIYR